MYFEKRHCCCCVPLPEGVMLVGLYGTSFHAGLLTIQLVFGHAAMIPTVTFTQSSQGLPRSHYTLEDYQPDPDAFMRSQSNLKRITYDLLDLEVVDVLYPALITAHCLGILVNILLSKSV